MNNSNYNKLNFGITLNGMDGSHYGNDCHNYGIISGCDEFCPALNNLECDVWTENIDFMDDDLIEQYKLKENNENIL